MAESIKDVTLKTPVSLWLVGSCWMWCCNLGESNLSDSVTMKKMVGIGSDIDSPRAQFANLSTTVNCLPCPKVGHAVVGSSRKKKTATEEQ